MAGRSTSRVYIKQVLKCRAVTLCKISLCNRLSIYLLISDSGATNPEYVVTADDVDKRIAVECIPMDDKGRQVHVDIFGWFFVFLYTNSFLYLKRKDSYPTCFQIVWSLCLLYHYLDNFAKVTNQTC